MAVIKCKMCGGDLNIVEGASTAECEYCGSVQTIPKVDDEKKLTLFARANRLRIACEFDKAAGIYEAIVADFPEEAEAYWGLVLCKYGIEYVDDPGSGKKIPTCHRSSFDSIMEDSDFEQALENADGAARRVYREEAKQIEEIRKGIISVSSNEQPYDIFICYKETAETGDRTLDSVLAQDVYDALTDKGYRVFFSRITLEDKLGTEYEPYIFAALNSAKIMLAFGTDYEHFNAVWVKNEWSRFLKLMAKDKTKHLIPCYKGIDAYDMPKEFAKLQAQDLGKVGAIQDLLRGIEKILPRQEKIPGSVMVQPQTMINNPTVVSYLKRATMALEDREWDNADSFCEQVLNIDPENAQAYLIKLLAQMEVIKPEQLANVAKFGEDNKCYKKLVRFADSALKETLAEYLDKAQSKKKQFNAKSEDFFYCKQHAKIEDGVFMEYNGQRNHVYIPDGVTSIGVNAFYECNSLETVIIPNSVTSIGDHAFSGCESLTSITIPDSVTSIGNAAFRGCKSLTSITIPNSVSEITGNPFPGLSEIRIAEGNTTFCLINGHLVNRKSKTLIAPIGNVPIPDGVTSIGNSAFCDCKFLTSVTIPNSVTSIGDCAFLRCKALTSITIPDSVTSIAQFAFSGCESLTSITIPDGVTSIGNNAFSGCESLTSITIPDSVTSIGDCAFLRCKSLTSITIPNSVTSIGDSAFSCYDKITILSSVGSYAWKWTEQHISMPRRQSGLCQHCGGALKGFFFQKCTGCGKVKDY